MELFFTDNNFKIGGHPFPEIPFFVDNDCKLIDELNNFFVSDLLVDGRISSSKTWKSYAYWLQDFFEWATTNGICWKEVSKAQVIAYRNWSLEDCDLSASTVNSRISVLKRFYNYAVRSSLAPSNPISEIVDHKSVGIDAGLLSHTGSLKTKRNDLSVKMNNQLPEVYSDIEIRRLFNTVKSDRLRLMMRVMLECGLRREEVALLPASVVEESIRCAQEQGPNSEIELKLPAHICKGKKSRTVILSYSTAMRLMQYRATVRPALVKRYKEKNKSEPDAFWLTRLGTAYRAESLTTEVSRLGEQAGVECAGPHKFRHTFATTLYSITGDLRLVQKLLGHSHIQTTTVYEHTSAVDRMGFFSDYQKQVDALISGGVN